MSWHKFKHRIIKNIEHVGNQVSTNAKSAAEKTKAAAEKAAAQAKAAADKAAAQAKAEAEREAQQAADNARRVKNAGQAAGRQIDQNTHRLANTGQAALKKFDQIQGSNLGGDNKKGFLNKELLSIPATALVQATREGIKGNSFKDALKNNFHYNMVHTGLGFSNKGPEENPGASSGTSGAIAALSGTAQDQQSAQNKMNALSAGQGIANNASSAANDKSSLNAGRISEDEQNNANSLLLKKLKKAGANTSFSNDFIR